VIHLVGAAGTILVLGAYFLVSTRRIRSESVAFQAMNLVGAALLTVYAVALTAWATVALNGVWGVIALAALVRVVRQHRRAGGPELVPPQ
jgi:lipid-A-disaccharide synthase-like uncharacterized protein